MKLTSLTILTFTVLTEKRQVHPRYIRFYCLRTRRNIYGQYSESCQKQCYKLHTCYVILSSGLPCDGIIYEPFGECLYQENTIDNWDILWYATRERCITIQTRLTRTQSMRHARRARWDG